VARPGLIPLLAVAGLAIGLTGLVALQLLILQPVLPAVALGSGAIAIIIIVLAIGLRRPRVVTSAEVALLLIYVLVLVGRSASSLASAAAPIVAGGVFLSAQLGWWAIELRTPVHEATPALWNRAGQIGASSLGAAIVAELIWQASRIHPGSGVVFVAVGLLAAIGVVVLYMRITAPQTEARATAAQKPSFQPRSERNRYRKHPRTTRQWLLGALDSLVRPAGTQAPWRSRHSTKVQTFLAIVLLLIDAGFTLVALGSSVQPKIIDGVRSFVGTGNAAPAIAFGLIGAGAIVLGWLALYLRSRVSPVGSAISHLRDEPPQISTLSDLETIRVMCRRAWRSGQSDLELGRFLDSLGTRLADNSLPSVAGDTPPPTFLAQVESTVDQMERVTDA
jgi:hypothetical protein